jgi:glycosyltransferase involved in cell wall biosynthesis
MNNIEITIGITSFNRFYYLSSLLDSLAICLPKNILCKIVVADNSSVDSNLVNCKNDPSEYIEKFKPHKFQFVNCEPKHWLEAEYVARNAVLENAEGEYLMFLQDDIQCLVDGLFLEDLKNIVDNHDCSQVLLDGVRKQTVRRKMRNPVRHEGKEVDFWQTSHKHFPTMGFSSLKLYKEVGLFMIDASKGWGQGENNYSSRVNKNFPEKSIFFLQVPSFAGIWNDPRGHYSFIRDGKRKGHYIKANSPDNLYYEILRKEKINSLNSREFPSSFTDITFPIGWDYAKEPNGEQKKYPQSKIIEEGPSEDIY